MENCEECGLSEIDCECVEIENYEEGEVDFVHCCVLCGESFESCECEHDDYE
jgi:hypothetical protein